MISCRYRDREESCTIFLIGAALHIEFYLMTANPRVSRDAFRKVCFNVSSPQVQVDHGNILASLDILLCATKFRV